VRIARLAEDHGVRLLAVHCRTRACGFAGHAEYDTIAEVKRCVRIPVLANGDIETPQDARAVLERTGADGLMIGRAAFGRPWLFREIEHFLATGTALAPPAPAEIEAVVHEHLDGLYALYGEAQGLRVARKHLGWYTKALPEGERFRQAVVRLEAAATQRAALNDYFARLAA